MKIKGKIIEGPKPTIVVIPRDGESIVFKCQAVFDFDDFSQICPDPKPPLKTFPGGKVVSDPEDPDYKQKVMEQAERRSSWLILKSLSATEGLEWDKVKINDPDTWKLYQEELSATFTPGEVNAIIRGVMEANSLDDSKLEEARNAFLSQMDG